jgi:hypothetical protein
LHSVKTITWHGSGRVMTNNWLEDGAFAWLEESYGAVSLSAAQ